MGNAVVDIDSRFTLWLICLLLDFWRIRWPKSSLSKCLEHSTEDWDGSPFARFSRTKSTHFFFSFSWSRAARCRKIAVCEGKYLLLNFFRCCSRQRHISSAFWGQRHSGSPLFTVTKPRCRSPFYLIANASPNPPSLGLEPRWRNFLIFENF